MLRLMVTFRSNYGVFIRVELFSIVYLVSVDIGVDAWIVLQEITGGPLIDPFVVSVSAVGGSLKSPGTVDLLTFEVRKWARPRWCSSDRATHACSKFDSALRRVCSTFSPFIRSTPSALP